MISLQKQRREILAESLHQVTKASEEDLEEMSHRSQFANSSDTAKLRTHKRLRPTLTGIMDDFPGEGVSTA